MLLVTLASSGGYPTAISAGNVTSEPPPAAALIAPARKPATAIRATAPALRSIAGERRSRVRGRGGLGGGGKGLSRSRQFSSITGRQTHGRRPGVAAPADVSSPRSRGSAGLGKVRAAEPPGRMPPLC